MIGCLLITVSMSIFSFFCLFLSLSVYRLCFCLSIFLRLSAYLSISFFLALSQCLHTLERQMSAQKRICFLQCKTLMPGSDNLALLARHGYDRSLCSTRRVAALPSEKGSFFLAGLRFFDCPQEIHMHLPECLINVSHCFQVTAAINKFFEQEGVAPKPVPRAVSLPALLVS